MSTRKILHVSLIIITVTFFHSCDDSELIKPRDGTQSCAKELLVMESFTDGVDDDVWDISIPENGWYRISQGILELHTGRSDNEFGVNAYITSNVILEVPESDTYYITVTCMVESSEDTLSSIIGVYCGSPDGYMLEPTGFIITSISKSDELMLHSPDCFERRPINDLPGYNSNYHQYSVKICRSAIWYYYDDRLIGETDSMDDCSCNIGLLKLQVGIGTIGIGRSIKIAQIRLEKCL